MTLKYCLIGKLCDVTAIVWHLLQNRLSSLMRLLPHFKLFFASFGVQESKTIVMFKHINAIKGT